MKFKRAFVYENIFYVLKNVTLRETHQLYLYLFTESFYYKWFLNYIDDMHILK